ncbi:hypothetical protein CC85DRAFT_52581 [Cutaneotrichosporon oleaginosum]|uniref:Uncharacterized protein n=1 Tax=Cutaneotrichosporon oleaginosum TaxID=879819 RepID=A0A0J1B6T3_9TREE|nr:uncharacterized protein CC85DRAFT_52581 [Cutaneotrichosporon oleaginosum]KLT43424.1 hypothetical protein CC85DRAFT_52581 [Cutaneotrichosporon oleaginosum]
MKLSLRSDHAPCPSAGSCRFKQQDTSPCGSWEAIAVTMAMNVAPRVAQMKRRRNSYLRHRTTKDHLGESWLRRAITPLATYVGLKSGASRHRTPTWSVWIDESTTAPADPDLAFG